MKSINHTKSFEIDISIEKIFPLFSPEGEKLWVPDWDYINIMETTNISENYVFLTKTHDHATTNAIWIINKYEPQSYFIQFYKIEPKDKIGIVTIKCFKLASVRTNVRVTYEYISLSQNGEKFISEFNESIYEKFINEWQILLSNYFNIKKG
jgi:hypothetical protein